MNDYQKIREFESEILDKADKKYDFFQLYHKTYYKESDVHTFIRENFNKKRGNNNHKNP
jgi:hypothetical protein